MIAGNQRDQVHAVTAGADGSIYIAGITNSTDFEVTPQAARRIPDLTAGTAGELFVRRISPDGGRLLYSTYLGPTREGPVALAVDSQGNAYVAGLPRLPNEVTSSTVLEPDGAIWLMKVSPAGDRIIYRVSLLPEGFYGPPIGLSVIPPARPTSARGRSASPSAR
jgi:hypothetical protein